MNAPTPVQSEATPTEWSEPDVGPGWRLKFFSFVLRYFGIVRAYHLSYFATLWYVTLHPSIRRRCRFYLNRRFPERRGAMRQFLDTYRLVRTFGKSLVDVAAMDVLGPTAVRASSPDHTDLAALGQRPDGFVMLHAHVGAWQLGMSTIRNFGKPVWVTLIPEPQTRQMLEKCHAGLIDPRQGMPAAMKMTDALLRGEIVAMMGDRTFGDSHNQVLVKFLGETINLPVTPYRLASATGVPIAVMLSAKTAQSVYEMRLAAVIHVPPRLGRSPQNYVPYAQQFADCLTTYVEKYPWQFFNFYDLWSGEDSVNA